MPHQIVEYSANLDAVLDIDELVGALHKAAAGIDALPVAGLRTRAVRRDVYRIADGHPDNAFIAVYLRVLEGRPVEVRQSAGKSIFAVLKDFVAEIYDSRPVALSFEVQEIRQDTRWNQNNLRDYLAQRGQETGDV